MVVEVADPYILDYYYVRFKNNCLLFDSFHDDIQFEPLHDDRDGKYPVVIRDGSYETHRWTPYTGHHGFEQSEPTCGSVRGMSRHINSMAPESRHDSPPPEKTIYSP